MGAVADRLREVRERIADAALRAGRDPAEVWLVAVTKTFPVTAVLEALDAGQRHFGENRPEEGAWKIPKVMRHLAAQHLAVEGPAVDQAEEGSEGVSSAPDRPMSIGPMPIWHMIGHIQSRKTDMVATHFDIVHSIDRLKIARRLSRLAVDAGREIPVLLECNVAGEESKYGYAAAGWEADSDVREALYSEVRALLDLPGLRLEGLMTVAPIAEDPEAVRPVFASLRGLLEAFSEEFPNVSWQHLSMGMTDNFEVAVEEGATLVRVGRAIFGPRA
ncbi:MAG: YggS family pyridoxal phosphate-dependent enzyme [Anaerolineae bacterium]